MVKFLVLLRRDFRARPRPEGRGDVDRLFLVAVGEHDRQRDVVGVALDDLRSEEHTSELQSQSNLVCRLLLEKKNIIGLVELCSSLSDFSYLKKDCVTISTTS